MKVVMQPCLSESSNVRKRGTSVVLTPKLAAALVKCKISDHNAVHILISTAEALGRDALELGINRFTKRHEKNKFWEDKAKEIQQKFKLQGMELLVVHWGGKLLLDLSGKKKVNRLPVIIFFEGMTQLLGVQKLESASGHNQANTVFETLSERNVANKVQALCCDTTALNTGRLNGVCFLLEHDLLYLPCQHHIFELVLRSVFDLKLSLATSGPDVPIFKNF